jgi:NADH dehydrogenase [ubiquinone] 1 alpha subcomplex assembly factor 6
MFLKRLVKARCNTNLKFVVTKQLEDYAEQSVSSVYYLLLEAMGIKNVHADHAASHLGKAQGITNLLRSIPHQSRRRAVPIPQEVLMTHGVSQERILRCKEGDKGVEECIFHMASLAHHHLEKVK